MSKHARTQFRSLDGLLLLDKPSGLSSNQALQRARHLFRAEKGGHTGSLDPLATGLLPLCFGEATKIAGYLLGNRKSYDVIAALGATTDTDDADGIILLERPVPNFLSQDQINAALQPLTGRIRQRPPIYSALKQGGEPLYAKARRGEVVDVPEREVDVESIELLAITYGSIVKEVIDCEVNDKAIHLNLRITCGSGTYVRSLVRDLGEALGCGAHVIALRRTWVDPFQSLRMYSFEELQQCAEQGDAVLEACVLPIAVGLANWPSLRLEDDQARSLGQGKSVPLILPFLPPAGRLHVLDARGRSLGVAELDEHGVLRAKRLFRWASLS